jgi:alkylation response protein AidB-like acyl-CoA dehydrogenase
MANQTVGDLLGAVERIGPLIAEHAEAAEANRQLSDAVYQAMYDAGLYAMLAPKAYGGLELHSTACIRVWEAIARIDAAAAWNLVMNQAIAAYSAWLPPKGIAELYAAGVPTIAGALHPPAKAVRVDGGWRIIGQVPFGSGCHQAQWLVMPAQEEGADAPFGAFLRRESATILDTWHTLGMRGTGSADFTVTDLFVPEHLTVPVAPLRSPPSGFEGPLYRMWPWSGIVGEGAVSVGVAAAAVDSAVHLCKTKTPAYQGTALRDQQLAQFLMGKPLRGSRRRATRSTAPPRLPTRMSSGAARCCLRRPKSACNWRCPLPRKPARKLSGSSTMSWGPRRSASDSPSNATSVTPTPCCSIPTNRARATHRRGA